jgi:penicillin-binding protein 2
LPTTSPARSSETRSRPLPPALPPAERTVGQLVAESLRLYGRRFWAILPVGLAPAVLDQLLTGHSRVVWLIAMLTVGAVLMTAAYVRACVVVLAAPADRGRLVRAFADAGTRGAIFERQGRPLAQTQPGANGDTRVYPQGATAGPLVGYVGEITAEELQQAPEQGFVPGDLVGRAGLEAATESALAGKRGGRLTVVQPSGEIAATLSSVPAGPGENVFTTLDLDLQAEAEAALGSRPGSVVVIDPRDGSVRALATFPRYDPNAFVSGGGAGAILNDPGQPLLERPLQGQYPPGSIFKVVTMSAALERGAFTPTSEFTCTGRWTGLPGVTMDCWLKTGHGRIDLVSGLTQSCDTVFYELGKRLDEIDQDYLPSFAARCGLGALPKALPGHEQAGIVPGPAWKQRTLGQPWTRGDAVNMAIGQGQLLVTPLQMAAIYAAIAAGGQGQPLRLLDRAALPGGNVERSLATAQPLSLPWAAPTLDAVRTGLKGVVGSPNGTAAFAFRGSPLAGVTAGKTGTAETAPGRNTHAWFACFAPFDAPRAVVLAMVEYGGEGSEVAAPIARRVLEAALR